MSQTAYSLYQLTAFAGQLGDVGPHDIFTGVWKGVSTLPFGVAVKQGSTSDAEVASPSASGDVAALLGVSAATQAQENLVSGQGSYRTNAAVGVLKKGRVWVQVEEAVTPASPVFVRYASGAGGTQLGNFRASADTASAGQVLHGMKYLTSAASGGFALLDVNLPN